MSRWVSYLFVGMLAFCAMLLIDIAPPVVVGIAIGASYLIGRLTYDD